MIKSKEYIKKDGKVYEVTGKDGLGRPTVSLVPGLKEIPTDEPLSAIREEAKEEAPKRRRKKA